MARSPAHGLAILLMQKKHPDLAPKGEDEKAPTDEMGMGDDGGEDAPDKSLSEEAINCAQDALDAIKADNAQKFAESMRDFFDEVDEDEDDEEESGKDEAEDAGDQGEGSEEGEGSEGE